MALVFFELTCDYGCTANRAYAVVIMATIHLHFCESSQQIFFSLRCRVFESDSVRCFL